MTEPPKISCPVCKLAFGLEEDLDTGDITVCPNCDADLEIISMDPLRVEEARFSYHDDYDDNYDDEDRQE